MSYGPSQKNAKAMVVATLKKLMPRLDEPMVSARAQATGLNVVGNLRDNLSDYLEADTPFNRDCVAYALDQAGMFLQATDKLFCNG